MIEEPNNKGFILEQKLREYLKDLKYVKDYKDSKDPDQKISEDEIDDIIREADINGDGLIDYKLFVKIMFDPKWTLLLLLK